MDIAKQLKKTKLPSFPRPIKAPARYEAPKLKVDTVVYSNMFDVGRRSAIVDERRRRVWTGNVSVSEEASAEEWEATHREMEQEAAKAMPDVLRDIADDDQERRVDEFMEFLAGLPANGPKIPSGTIRAWARHVLDPYGFLDDETGGGAK